MMVCMYTHKIMHWMMAHEHAQLQETSVDGAEATTTATVPGPDWGLTLNSSYLEIEDTST